MAILTIRDEQGNTIPIPALRGPQGTAGYSAYDIAVQNGFEGNQLDWLDSLVGPQGPQGPAGVWSLGAIDASNETLPPSGKAVYLALQDAGKVKTVNNIQPDANGNISLTITTSYNDLTNKPNLSTVATSGDYDDLNNKPSLFSGDYNDLSNKPSLFSGSYNDLTNKPNLSTVATSGSYTDLTNKPSLFSGSYTDLTDKPSLFSGSYTDLTDKPSLFSGSYNDLTNVPLVTSISASSTNTQIPTAKAVYDLIVAAIEDAIGGEY